LASTSQQILELQKQSLQNEFAYKAQSLEDAYKAKQEMLDMMSKAKEKEFEEREKKLRRYARKLQERASELEALDTENKVYYKQIGKGLLGAIPDLVGSYLGVETETPMKGAKADTKKTSQEPEEATEQEEALEKERQAKAQRTGVRSWRREKAEKNESSEQPE